MALGALTAAAPSACGHGDSGSDGAGTLGEDGAADGSDGGVWEASTFLDAGKSGGDNPYGSCLDGTCVGCCEGGVCHAGQEDIACGRRGGACLDCTTSERSCARGTCVTPCNPATCPGCCQESVCFIGTQDLACGRAGAACKACAAPVHCDDAGACD